MSKSAIRPYSRYSKEAAVLLGQLIRLGRIQRQMTVAELASRAGVSRGLIQRVERGDPGSALGTVFELAAIVGVRLFDADEKSIAVGIKENQKTLTLLPHSVRPSRKAIKDDF